jgi:DNA-binding CsgD family transcriptional regulator
MAGSSALLLPLPAEVSGTIVDRLALAVLVFRDHRLVYSNTAAEHLRHRLRARYGTELEVLLRDQLPALPEPGSNDTSAVRPALVALITATRGEPFYVHVIPLRDGHHVAVTVRVIGSEIDAVRQRHGLSAREAQVAELVLHGYRNADIASALGIAPGTAKKHLTKIFDKVGVNSRSQLQTRLA